MTKPSRVASGEWIGPPRKGADASGKSCRARFARSLTVLHPPDGYGRMMVQFDCTRLPQHLACFTSDVLLEAPAEG